MKFKDYIYLIIPFGMRLAYATMFFAGDKDESYLNVNSLFGFFIDIFFNYITILIPYLIVSNGVTCNSNSNSNSNNNNNINNNNIINILTQTSITQVLINSMILAIKSGQYFGESMTNFEDTNDFSFALLLWFPCYLIVSLIIIEINKKQSDVFCKKNIYEKINVGSLFTCLVCILIVALLKFIPVYLELNKNECKSTLRNTLTN